MAVHELGPRMREWTWVGGGMGRLPEWLRRGVGIRVFELVRGWFSLLPRLVSGEVEV